MAQVDPEVIAGRYELRAQLGRGASATVHRAYDRTLGREVALKLLHDLPTDDQGRRFQREIRIAARLRHPDVIEVYDVGEHGGRPYLVMELVTAPSLAGAIAAADDPPTVATAITIGERLARLLGAAHEVGVVHRDVKPANVFVEGSLAAPQRCRLADFGIAFLRDAEAAELGRFTVEGTLLGTPLYMSPEQAEGHEVGPPTDLYALGCVVHELVAGRPPFVGNIARVLAGHMYLPPIALRELDPEVPAELEALVLALLDKDPARRPAAAEAALRFADLAAEVARSRTHALEPRHVRAVGAAPQPAADGSPARISLAVADEALAIALRDRAIAIDDADDALVVAPLEGDHPWRVWIAVHPEPTPAVIARAIREGAAAVVRWPGSPDAVASHVVRAWRARARP